ncbi:hypothetical protein ACTXT7_016713 [Hymenolepis weldensis]
MLQTWGATPERRPPFEYLRTYFEEYFVSPEPPGLFPDALSLRRADKMASMDTGENLGIMCIEPGESFESEEEEELVDAELMNLARNMANQINGNHHSHQQNHSAQDLAIGFGRIRNDTHDDNEVYVLSFKCQVLSSIVKRAVDES